MRSRRVLGRRALAGAPLLLVPLAWPAQAAASDIAAAIREAIGDAVPTDEGISLRLPPVAENGFQVPVTVLVDSPQTSARHVVAITLIASRNPTPGIVTFRLSPAIARAEVQTRIRLAEDQEILALATMSDGSVRRAAAAVRVATSGCLT
jgi:sulfur-oxidizing protein SoxY